jgi:D-arabinose 1-dehydrogenase-like Zn-dependent alcohol dehydrogenase
MLSMVSTGKLNPEIFIKNTISLEEAPEALRNMNISIQDGITVIKPWLV